MPASGVRTTWRSDNFRRVDASVGGTPAERSTARHRRIAIATVAGLASRVIMAVALLAALPLASGHLDDDQLGVWSLLVTAVGLVGFADLGIGNGLLNVLTSAIGKGDQTTAQQAVTNAAYGALVIAVVGAALSASLAWTVPWPSLLRVPPVHASGVRDAVFVFGLAMSVAIPAAVGQKVHLAYQQGWAASATSGLGALLSIGFVAVAAASGADLPWFVAAMVGPPVVASVGETLWVFFRSHVDLRPRRHHLHRPTLRRIVRSGSLFGVLALAGATGYHSDTIIIAGSVGAEAVTVYAVVLRLFMLGPTALAALLLPLWPAYGEALARGDSAWLRQTLRTSLLLSAAVSFVASCVFVLSARPLLDRWVPEMDSPSFALLMAMGCWAVVSAVSMAVAMYLNGLNLLRFQVAAACAMAAANIALSVIAVRWIGVSGPVWASVFTQTVLVLAPATLVVRRSLRALLGSERSTERGTE